MKNRIEKKAEKPFSVFLFAVTIALTLVFFAIVLRNVFPAVWRANLGAPLWEWVTVFLVTHLGLCFGEFFFHRYMLHSPFWFLKRLCVQHTLHHDLTKVKLIAVLDGEGKVFNRYPIIEKSQYEASYFPWYSLAVFGGLASFLSVPIQILLPGWPIVAGVILAVAWSVSLYEIIHMIEHFPFPEFWEPKLLSPRWGELVNSFYCFHLRHHLDLDKVRKLGKYLNLNISGFFGLPIADWLFGTYAPCPKAYKHGEIVSEAEFDANYPTPCWLIRFLDRYFLSEVTQPS